MLTALKILSLCTAEGGVTILMTNQDILRIALEQQAIDNSCSPEDFLKNENVVVISKPHETKVPREDALPLTLRPLEDADIPLMSQWLQQPYVKKWYDPIDEWLYEIRERHSTYSWLHHFIVKDGAIPIGFGQYYDCFDSVGLEQWKGREFTKRGEVYSIDYLIGDNRYLGKGHGKQIVRQLSDTVFALGAKEIIVDPDKSNLASQGVLMANGYIFNEEQGYYAISARSFFHLRI
jgi:RimJ/RimL family protein N-acetyltransferase